LFEVRRRTRSRLCELRRSERTRRRLLRRLRASLTPSSAAHTEPANVTEPAIRILLDASSAALDGERKTVTALFADLKGSTELMRDLDPEEARAIIDPTLKLMIDAVHRYDGYVVQSTGDGIFALFGAPVAHEDHPQRALHAALAMRNELRRRGEDLRMRGRAGVEVRIGINTGEVVMRTVQTGGHTEYAPVGHVINLASRMQSVAPSNGVVVSEETRRLVEGYFELREMGPTEVRGIGGPVNVYEVVGSGALRGHFDLAARRGLTKFVGRQRELEQMQHALELAMSGHGQIVAVMAEAGTGKSRLFYEFKATLPPTCKLLEVYSVSHGKASAWLPVLELLRGYFSVQNADDAASRRGKVRATLAALEPALSDTLLYLFALLGIQDSPDPIAQMDAQIKRQRTLDAIKRIILNESLKQPVVVIFEDLHWIDAQTQTLLDLLVDGVANSRVLLLFNYRPEYRHEWTNKSYYAELRLDPLDESEGTTLLTALLGESVELNPLKRLIAERTGGNPFFIEEIVQALFDEGALVRNGAMRVTRALSQLRLPSTVQGILAARIDRLSADQKELLQTMAVIGRESPLALVRRMTTAQDVHLNRMVAELRTAEFIYEQALADTEYVFKHALTQEVAYNSLLIERRKLLHERAGQALESMFAQHLDDHLSELAHHYSHSDNVGKAVEYLGRAGQQAMQRSAHDYAISNFTAALDLLGKLPENPERIERELMLQLPLGQGLQAVRGYTAEEAKRAFTRARELCKRLGDRPELFRVLWGLWAVHLLRGERHEAHRLAQQLLMQAENTRNPAQLLMAHGSVGMTLFEFGEYLSVREHLEKGISFYNRERDRPLGLGEFLIPELSYLASTLNALGYPDQALKRAEQAVVAGQEFGHPFTLTFALHFSTFLRAARREAHEAQAAAERVIELSTEHGFAFWLAQATSLRGEAIAEQGRTEEGIAEMLKGLAAMRAIGFEGNRAFHLAQLAKAYSEVGRLDEALSTLEEALAEADQNEERKNEAERLRLKGELLLRQSDTHAAEPRTCFERAIEIARTQGAKWFELRATTSLARLLARQSHRDEAHAALADIYNWFTEGFDTADLKDAKALLDELAG